MKQRRENLSSDSITCTTLYVWYHLINFHWFTYMYLSGYSVLFRSTKPLLFLSTIRPVFDAEENTDHPHCSGIVRPVLKEPQGRAVTRETSSKGVMFWCGLRKPEGSKRSASSCLFKVTYATIFLLLSYVHEPCKLLFWTSV